MTNGGYDAFDDPYSYKGTNVLKNRLRTRDPDILEAFELEMTTLRADEPLPEGRFGAAHYRSVHRHLFQDVYSWAGRYRTVRTAKGGNWFCFPEHIPQQMDRLFAQLRADDLLASDNFDDFVQRGALFLAELNARFAKATDAPSSHSCTCYRSEPGIRSTSLVSTPQCSFRR